ncbi:hypothetical protein ACJX0J_042151 [Zea mays]
MPTIKIVNWSKLSSSLDLHYIYIYMIDGADKIHERDGQICLSVFSYISVTKFNLVEFNENEICLIQSEILFRSVLAFQILGTHREISFMNFGKKINILIINNFGIIIMILYIIIDVFFVILPVIPSFFIHIYLLLHYLISLNNTGAVFPTKHDVKKIVHLPLLVPTFSTYFRILYTARSHKK